MTLPVFDFNQYTFQEVTYEVDSSQYTFLNTPTTMSGLFQFTNIAAFESAKAQQTVIMDSGNIVYTRTCTQNGINPNTYSFSAWITSSGGGSNLQAWYAATNTPTLANGVDTGFQYINLSTGTNSVNFGAGSISFVQNDTVSYNTTTHQWYNSGQADGVQTVTSSDDSLTITTTNGNVNAVVTGTVRQKTVNYQMLPVDRVVEIQTNNNLVITLVPPYAGMPVGTGVIYTVKLTGSVATGSMVSPVGYTLNGGSSVAIKGVSNAASAYWNGTQFMSI